MSSTRRSAWRCGAIVAAALMSAEVAQSETVAAPQAPTWSDWGSVREMEAGWSLDTMSIYHNAPFVNPHDKLSNLRCDVKDSYATDPTDPGHSLFHTVLLSGFLNRKEVRLLISGCVFGKPKIIAVGIR